MNGLLQDVRYVLRQMNSNRGFTSIAVLTLALGIGANTAIFGVVDSVFLRALPFRESQRLVHVWTIEADGDQHTPTAAHYQAVGEQVNSFEQVAALGPVYNTTTLATLVPESLAQRRFTVLPLAAFSVLALILAAIGRFGVISYLVTQRTREFGVRMAFGAERRNIYRQVLSRAAAVGIIGCGIGIALSFLASGLLRASLYRVNRFDAETILLARLRLPGVAFLAAFWPARRAAQIDPMVASRYE